MNNTVAKHISSLHDKIAELEKQAEKTYREFARIDDAAQFMEQLNGIIKKTPVVYDEWKVFLSKAGIEEPDWKADYEPFSSRTLVRPNPLPPIHAPVRYTTEDLTSKFEEAQKRVIEVLEEKISNLEFQIRNHKKVIDFSTDHAEFYLAMQRKIIAEPSTMAAWKTFLMMMKLSLDQKDLPV